MNIPKSAIFALFSITLTSCSFFHSEKISPQFVDVLLTNGLVYNGTLDAPFKASVAICQQVICGIYTNKISVDAKRIIDVEGRIISPGFIDPHTHTVDELSSTNKNSNLNYLTQGVTTVINGNDGDSPVDIAATAKQLKDNGIGTNVAFYIGHNTVRRSVMGTADRFSTQDELTAMKTIVAKSMEHGALGLSSGLFYVPGNYANTHEVIELAKVVSNYNGIYDTHLRDESTFNIGLLPAIDEAINVAEKANIHLHIAHIKALGVDVWGQSQQVINKIAKAQRHGVSISADQYPWLASGTKLHSAVIPKWVMADSTEAFHQRLNDPKLKARIFSEISENIRRRGGANALLVTAFKEAKLVGKTLEEIAHLNNTSPVQMTIDLVQKGEVRVASFNMSPEDVELFMNQPWVVTSSDGTNGHPRKYASFPKKLVDYVKKKQSLSLTEFIHRSSGKTAQILGLADRGFIKLGAAADIIVFNPNNIKVNADFSTWNEHSEGMDYVIVNGAVAIDNKQYKNILSGQFVRRTQQK